MQWMETAEGVTGGRWQQQQQQQQRKEQVYTCHVTTSHVLVSLQKSTSEEYILLVRCNHFWKRIDMMVTAEISFYKYPYLRL